jgi:hypothetical protein
VSARQKPKYNFEIDVQDYSIDGPVWRNYGTLVTWGDTLEELLANAGVDIVDQDGGEVWCGPADAGWMQDLIEQEYRLEVARHVRLEQVYAYYRF